MAVGGIGLTAAVSALSSNPVASLAQPERTYAALYGTGRLDLVTGVFANTKTEHNLTIWKNLGPHKQQGP